MDGGESLFSTINKWADLDSLIEGGEAEGLHLECKSPGAPQFNREQKRTLAIAISGFSNTSGGVVLYGVSTTKHDHSGLDILSQLEPIGQVKRFEQLVLQCIPTLNTATTSKIQTKIVRAKPNDSKGILVVFIPKSDGDPVQSIMDNCFYFRTGDEFKAAPFDLIRRMFSATKNPDLQIIFLPSTSGDDGTLKIPIGLSNESSAIAEHVKVIVKVKNPDACDRISSSQFIDASDVNPGETIFVKDFPGVIHRGLNSMVGELDVKMKVDKQPRRRLDLIIMVFANNMKARQLTCQLYLTQSGFTNKNAKYSDVY